MNLKPLIPALFFTLITSQELFSQKKIDDYINITQATKILSFLASDSLGGRVAETPGIDTAAAFIAEQFRIAGIPALSNFEDYFQLFVGVSEFSDKTVKGKNVVSMLPGNALPDEYVIFCAHYDHISKAFVKNSSWMYDRSRVTKKDTIFNGANDDGSGINAMLLLADFFAAQHNNARSIMFIAFAGEEDGLLGSQYFNSLIDPLKRNQIKAVINIEMIGRNEFKKQNSIITGDDYSNFYDLMNKSLKSNKDSGFKSVFLRDNFPGQKSFSRSDNYSFYLNKIPAHTVTSSTDNDKYYHTVDDEVEYIDFENIVHITKAIAWGTEDFISGKSTVSISNKN